MDREKVIKWLDVCKTSDEAVGINEDYPCRECPYKGSTRCIRELIADAIAILQEQDAEISRISNAYLELVAKASKQPKVVRCKDCKYFQMHEYGDFHKRIWPEDGDHWYECLHPDDDGEHGTRTRGSDWFCADGVRKNG